MPQKDFCNTIGQKAEFGAKVRCWRKAVIRPNTDVGRVHYRAHAVLQWRRHVAAFPRGRDAREKCESPRTHDD